MRFIRTLVRTLEQLAQGDALGASVGAIILSYTQTPDD